MPSANTVKKYLEGGIYHVYNRGVEKRRVFLNRADYIRFMKYFDIYLGAEDRFDSAGVCYPKLNDQIELLAFCLMPNHFHLLVKQKTQSGLTDFMRRIMTGYAMYFNLKYRRVGPLFQGIYKGSLIENQPYLLDISSYIHLNPNTMDLGVCLKYPYSSLKFYTGGFSPNWLSAGTIIDSFDGIENYMDYCKARAGFQEDQPLEFNSSDVGIVNPRQMRV